MEAENLQPSARVSNGEFELLDNLKQFEGVPKALLPGPDNKPLINTWWTLIQSSRTLFNDVRTSKL